MNTKLFILKKITSAFIGTFRIHKDKYDHFAIHKNIKSLCYISETDTVLYGSYNLIFFKKGKRMKKYWKKKKNVLNHEFKPLTSFIFCCWSVAKLCLTLCNSMNHSMAGFPCPLLFLGVCLNSCPLSQWCHPTVSSSATLFSSSPQSFLVSGSPSVSQPLGVPWTARRSNQSILKEINSEYSLEGLMLKLKL